MYESFYGFKEKPFTLLPDPGFLYFGKKHSMALAMLQYSLLNKTIITVLSGEIGSGKTTLIRHLLNMVDENVNVGLITHTHKKFGELLQWVNLAFGLDYERRGKVALYQQFIDFLIEKYSQGQRSILIIDEAQNLDVEALEEIRLLSNVNADKDQILQLMLVGQPELRQKLKRPDLAQLIQRVGVAYHLKPFSPEETDNYIMHRLKMVEGDPDLFEPVARRFIHHQSGGIPRLINVLCDTALVYAYADRKKRIGGDIAYAVVQDKMKGGLLTPKPREQKTTEASASIETEPRISSPRTLSPGKKDKIVSGHFAKPI
jgi:type II secretory pathway predicted ATPase ExeA